MKMQNSKLLEYLCGKNRKRKHCNTVILAIDASYASSGIAVISYDREIQYITTIKTKREVDKSVQKVEDPASIGKRLSYITETIEKIIEEYQITLILMESNFTGGSKEVNWVLGNIYRISVERGIPIKTFAPASIKKAVTGSGKATKADMKVAITNLYGKIKTNNNVIDAIGVAHCYFVKEEIK
ncbi:crossover junction endodeoxyribonuclease RuvC [Paenibacillus contaminans]|nr:crossover junction endodeoxyribonuclease RuvC [Paenibacillus contaminans]